MELEYATTKDVLEELSKRNKNFLFVEDASIDHKQGFMFFSGTSLDAIKLSAEVLASILEECLEQGMNNPTTNSLSAILLIAENIIGRDHE